jgi:hypothetical protein
MPCGTSQLIEMRNKKEKKERKTFANMCGNALQWKKNVR